MSISAVVIFLALSHKIDVTVSLKYCPWFSGLLKTDFHKVTVDLHGSSLLTRICKEHGNGHLPRPFCRKLLDSTRVVFNTGLEKSLELLIEHGKIFTYVQDLEKVWQIHFNIWERSLAHFFHPATVNCLVKFFHLVKSCMNIFIVNQRTQISLQMLLPDIVTGNIMSMQCGFCVFSTLVMFCFLCLSSFVSNKYLRLWKF